MSTQVYKAGLISGRPLVLLVSFSIQALFFYALVRNIGALPFMPPDEPLQVSFRNDPPPPADIVDARTRDNSTRLIPKQIVDPKIPDVPFPADDVQDAVIHDNPQPAAGGSGADIRPAPSIAPTPLRYTELRRSHDYYPPVAIRMSEQGVTQVRVCVSAAGSLQGIPTVTAGSGYRRLDVAAVAWAREALRFEPATQNGVAVDACKEFRVNFRLH